MADRYQPIDRLRARIDYEPDDIFTNNEAKRFDRLLGGEAYVGDDPDGWQGLEAEARAMIETLSGDEPWSREVDRVDEFRPTDNAAIPLVYPIDSIAMVEIKRSQRGEWEELDGWEYDHTDHHLVLPRDTRAQKRPRDLRPANELLATTQRRTWYDVAVRVRVTYTRGFDPVPQNIQQIQVALVNRMCRQLKGEKTIAAANPEEFAGVSPEMDAVLTERLRERINSLTPLGGGTRAV